MVAPEGRAWWLQGGKCAWLLPGGVCVVFAGGRAWFFLGGACVVFARGVHGFSWGVRGFSQGGACVGYNEIRSMSGRYASYWKAFLLSEYSPFLCDLCHNIYCTVAVCRAFLQKEEQGDFFLTPRGGR